MTGYKALAVFMAFTLLAGAVSAGPASGITDFIKSILRALGLIKGPKPPPQPEIVCNPPYIRVGATCCLDRNGNSICDKDETWPKTTTSTTSTTTLPTTSTTVKPRPVACTVNSDCGEEKTTRICYNGDVYLKTESPYCTRPGTTYSRCIIKVNRFQDHPLEKCSRGCRNGTCL